MFDAKFSHFLSYGSTDQQTLRDLRDEYSGLIVPGTVAAFQREGTGGFVLTMSAASESTEYAIDPRFPLFQQALVKPKKSHESLAALFGTPGLIRATSPDPADFDTVLVDRLAANWVAFNQGYREDSSAKFTKYAKRLGRDLDVAASSTPSYVLAPYFMATGPDDPWWKVSVALYGSTRAAMSDPEKCLQVIAATSPDALSELLDVVPGILNVIWVNALDELTADHDVLASYGIAIERASENGKQLFALYGGFFSVLMSAVGLAGSSHGIGFSENRNWVELPSSGPPPARYYLPQLHRYLQADEADRLFDADPELARCACDECANKKPSQLDYHALMKHSVHCRSEEINGWDGLSVSDCLTRLHGEQLDFQRRLAAVKFPPVILARFEKQARHLYRWIDALRALDHR